MVRVAVLGCGVLGAKVAAELAYHGHEVRVYDCSVEALDKVQPRVAEDVKLLRRDGLLNQPDFIGCVLCFRRLEDAVRECEFVFEVITEDLNAKQTLLETVSRTCKQQTILGSSSMHLQVDSVFEKVTAKERCIGVRFLFPVFTVTEVEIQMSSLTSVQTLGKLKDFLQRMGKTPYHRSGGNPLVLNDAQREYRWASQIHWSRQPLHVRRRPPFIVPDLNQPENIAQTLQNELVQDSVRDNTDCVVCMDEERNCVLHPCHHLCMCATCGKMLLKRQDSCPICRKKIQSIFRIFYS